MSQKQSQKSNDKPLSTGDQLEVSHTIDPPPISDTLNKVKLAVKQAVKSKVIRTHRCRVCHDPTCPHFQREYDDDKEEFDDDSAPDLDGNRRE